MRVPLPNSLQGKRAFMMEVNGNEVISTHQQHNAKDDGLEKRETWSNKIQFLLGCMGFSVGLGNVWRFPYLCYRNGGGAFLLPYFFSVFVGAIPIFMLEIAMGQYTAQGVITCWNLVPIFKGMGYAMSLMLFLHNIYYHVIMGWSFHYLFASFTTVLPWSNCDNNWNTPLCRKEALAYSNLGKNITDSFANQSSLSLNYSTSEKGSTYLQMASEILGRNMTTVDLMMINGSVTAVDPVTEYWERKVLAISPGIDQPGVIKWDLALCLLLAWIVVYFCVWKGIKWSGKIMYVSTTTPYLLMLILLIRGVTLPGAWNGIKYYLYPDISKLTNVSVWYGAASQVFFSYSMCHGSLTALGSFNKFHHNFWKDSILFAIVNSGTSLMAGFIIFSILGYMSHIHQVSIDQVAESGPGLAFIAYPKAVAELPGAPAWAIMFFVMLILLGMDSGFGCVEGFVTALIDIFPQYLRRKYAREILVAVVCFVSFLIGLSMVTNGGMYVFLIFDYYCINRSIIVIAFFEITAMGWIYGTPRLYDHMEEMLGRKVGPQLKICWRFITPAFTLALLVLCFYQYSHVTYNRTYIYPVWAIVLGWSMTAIVLVVIPLMAVYEIIQAKGTLRQRLRFLTIPQIGRRADAYSEDEEKKKEKKEKKDDIELTPASVKLLDDGNKL